MGVRDWVPDWSELQRHIKRAPFWMLLQSVMFWVWSLVMGALQTAAAYLFGTPDLTGLTIVVVFVVLSFLTAALTLGLIWLWRLQESLRPIRTPFDPSTKEEASRAKEVAPALTLSFEPRAPWINFVPNARTPPKTNPNPSLPVEKWVETNSLWFRLQVHNGNAQNLARGVRVHLTNVEIFRDGGFSDVGFGAQQQLRWANDAATPFEPRDIHHIGKHYVDVISVDDEHNKVFVKWAHPEWLSYRNLFDKPGRYRLTVIATSADGEGTEIKLNLNWTGQWNQTEMRADDSARASEASVVNAVLTASSEPTILATTDSNTAHLAAQGAVFPDMLVHELFHGIEQNVCDDAQWRVVGRQVKDNLSLGRLQIWGRKVMDNCEKYEPHDLSELGPLKEIEKSYWEHVDLTYWFLSEDHQYADHVLPLQGVNLPAYADLQVNRSQAESIWAGLKKQT